MGTKRILRTAPAAEYLDLKPSTLEKYRVLGIGPRFIRIGQKAVAYDLADLDNWIDRRKVQSTSDRPA
jgi:predicted DNA-binding transcriptional regulator AlpA